MQKASVTVWSEGRLEEIKKIYGADLTPTEFSVFLEIGRATNLNPYLREIWAVKYGKQAASIFIGRDGYRKSAQSNPLYDYHYVDAVYSEDEFEVIEGKVKHRHGKSGERGKLVGAYCVVARKGATLAMYHYVDFAEYYSGNKTEDGKQRVKKNKNGEEYAMKENLWDTKPATMIKKVAEAQGLRMAFQELFAGTYDESEAWEEVRETVVTEAPMNEVPDKVNEVEDLTGLLNLLSECKSLEDFSTKKNEILEKINECKNKQVAIDLVMGAKKKFEIKEVAVEVVDVESPEIKELVVQIQKAKTAKELAILKAKCLSLPKGSLGERVAVPVLLGKIEQMEGAEMYHKAREIFSK